MRYWNTYEELDFDTHSTVYLQVAWCDDSNLDFWGQDYLYISGDLFDSLDGMRVLRQSGALPDFDFYDNTVVYKEDWERMKQILTDMGGEYEIFVSEIAQWVGVNGFDNHKSFVIIGV